MNSIINYFIEANICLLVLGLFHYFFLRNENHFQFNRLYLLGTIATALVFPALKLGNLFSATPSINFTSNFQEALTLTGFTVFANPPTSSTQIVEASALSWFQIAGLIYIAVSIILMTIFCYQIFQVFYLGFIKRKNAIKSKKYMLIPTDGQLPTFAFFNMLFFDNTANLTEQEKQNVLDHELVHIKQRHSLDIILFEFLKILFWINPVCWYLKYSAQQTHEYLADKNLVKQTGDEAQYAHLLATMTLRQMSLGIGNHFNQSFTLKRIKMMKKPISKFKTWKGLALVPIVVLLFIAMSCNDEVMNDVNAVMETATQAEMPADLQDELPALQEKYPNADFFYMETSGTNAEALDRLKDVDPNSIAYMKVYKDNDKEGTIGMIVNRNGALRNVSALNKNDDETFQIVEQPAMPKGGYDVFYQNLSKNMQYPVQARKLGIEGKVYVQFVVDVTGELTDVKVVKGIGGGCDAEAERVVAASEPWSPPMQRGKNVKQRIILPITFALGNKTKNPVNIGFDEVIEIKGDNEKMKVSLETNDLITTGKVMKEDGKPLPGVNIIIGGTGTGTVSDIDGTFKIKLNDKNDKLFFSFVGYETQTRRAAK